VAGLGLNLHWMLFGVTSATLGYSCIQIGILARIIHGLRSGIETTVQRYLTYNRGMTAAGVLVVTGLVSVSVFAWQYVAAGFRLEHISYAAIFGLLLVILGFQTFAFTLLLEMLHRVVKHHAP
jgi:hypothetical protein